MTAASGALHPSRAGTLLMANIMLFHSVLGLRHAERQVAAQLGTAAHEVCVPDLFAGKQTDDLNEAAASILLGRVLAFLRGV